ncbi:dihydrofolate reductase family protein [Actinotalea sp. C106]|uniref:dihydrofolate reductase family protein n=1 Tax=Actinotalea sp. C106 TaxID=2908644 RepID=UPI0020292E04|nr:dihydrofolate reductase family protein [Actinotalea sp. C106]
MSRLLYSATMSLDGFIAGPDGDMSWLGEIMASGEAEAPGADTQDGDAPDTDVEDLMAGIGALLIGRRTFDGDDPNAGTEAEGAFGGQWQGPSVVLTHAPPPVAPPRTTFATDLVTAVEEAKAAAEGRYVNVLGADVARQCLEAGLLDEVLVFVAPVLLGDGTRLFQHDGGTRIPLTPMPGRSVHGLWFTVER